MAHDGQGRSVTIVGGGLAGLAAATYLARAGHRVTVSERAPAAGGRATTHERAGYRFNQGPHALYRKAEGAAVLRELGVAFHGRMPGAAGGLALAGGAAHALPGGFVSLLTTSLFGIAAKLETARVLATFHKIDAGVLADVSVRAWTDRHLRQPEVRRLLLALFRLATYGGAPEEQSAGAAIAQLQRALAGNVLYLDGGWQTLVDGLAALATAAGATIRVGAGVERVEPDGHVHLRDGATLAADAVLIAAGPDVAADLVVGGRAGALGRAAASAVPVRAACLDVALRTLPVPRATFALGIDEPHYLSVHSTYADLAPAGGALVHVARYCGAEKPTDPRATERELEHVLDLVQPGWKAHVVERRYLPAMTVSHALPRAATGGLAGRFGPAVPQMPGIYVAGDWVGDEGMLADASLASARRAAALIDARLATSAAA